MGQHATENLGLSPHWISKSSNFWYRNELPQGGFEFIFVDTSTNSRRRAFDHQDAARKLQQLTNKTTNAESLPFSWIQPAPDALHVRFRAHGKAWTFTSDGLLEECHDAPDEGVPNLLDGEVPSPASDTQVHITFVNHDTGPLTLEWIDFEGNPVFYGDIDIGEERSQRTYVGHVWRLTDASGAVKAVYAAPEHNNAVVIDGGTMQELVVAAEESRTPKRQATSFPRVTIHNYNVWVAFSDGENRQITTNGNRERPYDQRRVYISPDKKHLVAWQYTPQQERIVTFVESSPKDQVQPKLKQIQYLKPGDRVRVDRPRIFSLDTRSEISTDDSLFKTPYHLESVGWSIDSKEYRFLYNERGHQMLRIIGISLGGTVRTLVEESSKSFIDYSSKTYRQVLNETDELIWASERDGWNHLYLYDLTKGALQNQITKGEWLVRSVEKVDAEARRIWFRGFRMVPGQDPYYAHLARVNFDGTGLKILTEGNGTHTWKWSPGERQFTDTWSRIDQPPTSVLRDAETGAAVLTLEESNTTAKPPAEIFVSPGRDGKTPIHGIIIRPSNFDPTKKYPILEDVYAGPQDFFTPKAYSNLTSYREWADRGYIVVKLDGMGTNWRSKAFHDVCYKNLKDAGFPDRVAWIQAAAKTRPWMDTTRVGIKGGSAGGQNAMGALLFHGDFYKAAVADSGCHDNRMDKIWWNEQWMGWPVDQAYEDSSNVVHAGRLRGALMLIVGELDDNVDPASTLQVVNALNGADKDYELLFVPGGGHGAGSSRYGRRRQADFFERHLGGVK
ncbi:Alpha/Beta hydrolase protein [Immersiella caudata]|uniref:Probable dipeptidyl-aminopeptidase B n=1 Tax=Immersiella caudata TaxID=314043 RepID=A0AA39WS09_9PEZI|nr:Alpha/Beta hydrolase protein [Immersiella caudata]